MKQNILSAWYKLLCIVILVMLLFSCVPPQNLTPSEQKIFTTVRTLETAKEFRVTALTVAGDFYKQGLMDEKIKDQIIIIANELQNAINITSDSLQIYLLINNESNLIDLESKILIYQNLYGQFSELVLPYILKNI